MRRGGGLAARDVRNASRCICRCISRRRHSNSTSCAARGGGRRGSRCNDECIALLPHEGRGGWERGVKGAMDERIKEEIDERMEEAMNE